MWIKDLWDRILANFKKEEDTSGQEPVMELRPETAPEPVPDRKTSDEMIIEMAQSVSSDRSAAAQTGADADAGAGAADEAERSAGWEIHEDTDPADVTDEAGAPAFPGSAEETAAAAWEVHEDTDPADVTEEAEAAGWEIHEDTDPVCDGSETDVGEDKKDGN